MNRQEQVRINRNIGVGIGWFLEMMAHFMIAIFMFFIFSAGAIILFGIIFLVFLFTSLARAYRKWAKKEKIRIFIINDTEKRLWDYLENLFISMERTFSRIFGSAGRSVEKANRLSNRINRRGY